MFLLYYSFPRDALELLWRRLCHDEELHSSCFSNALKLWMELDMESSISLLFPQFDGELLWKCIKRHQTTHFSMKVRRVCVIFSGYLIYHFGILIEHHPLCGWKNDLYQTWIGYLEDYSHEDQPLPLRKAVMQSLRCSQLAATPMLSEEGHHPLMLRCVWAIICLLQDDDEMIRRCMAESISWGRPKSTTIVLWEPTRCLQLVYREVGHVFGATINFHYQFSDHLLNYRYCYDMRRKESKLFFEERPNMFIEDLLNQQLCYLTLRNTLQPAVWPLYIKRTSVLLEELQILLTLWSSQSVRK
jgi:hypothetical protein